METLRAGCYADGTFGHDYVRGSLRGLLESYIPDCDPKVLESLASAMPDDAWDEDEAMGLLNTKAPDGMCWGLLGGDLMYGPTTLEFWGQ